MDNLKKFEPIMFGVAFGMGWFIVDVAAWYLFDQEFSDAAIVAFIGGTVGFWRGKNRPLFPNG